MELWRLTTHPDLSGEGGRLYAARWNSAGAPVVYLATSPGSSYMEILVHLQIEDDELPNFTLLRITAPDDLEIPLLHTPANDTWKRDLQLTRKLGDAWLKSRRSALARVPSAILPSTFNYLFNPLHADAARIQIESSQQAFFDPRLLR